ncbi:MAG TPA: ATP synthase F1 subunit gamma [Myxococcales bacterium]|nr:ATP synthase F1 subunit gamma [Myxococcales bacterium]
MASLRFIRTRIRSVRNTQKITKAMKMVAAAKLRRAQDAVVRARPYAQLIDEMLAQLSRARAEADLPPHPLMAVRPLCRVELLLMTSDRGLCGGFNSNIIRRGQRFLVEEGSRFERIQFSTVGRRGRDFARKRGIETRKDYVGFFGRLRYAQAREVAEDLIQAYEQDELDAVYLLYNEFKSAIVQQISLVQLLPLQPRSQAPTASGEKGFIRPEHVFEPSRPEVLQALIPRFLAMQIWRALLESEASEHGARMTAMDSATKNASEMIGRLTLDYNRARQAAITKELMEIVSGAEALK